MDMSLGLMLHSLFFLAGFIFFVVLCYYVLTHESRMENSDVSKHYINNYAKIHFLFMCYFWVLIIVPIIMLLYMYIMLSRFRTYYMDSVTILLWCMSCAAFISFWIQFVSFKDDEYSKNIFLTSKTTPDIDSNFELFILIGAIILILLLFTSVYYCVELFRLKYYIDFDNLKMYSALFNSKF